MCIIWPMESCEMWDKSKIILGCVEKKSDPPCMFFINFKQNLKDKCLPKTEFQYWKLSSIMSMLMYYGYLACAQSKEL